MTTTSSTRQKENDMPSKNDDAAKARNKVYYAARAALIENHQDEYRQLLEEHAKEAGVTLTLRKSPEEKAQEQLAKLYEEFPHLAPEGYVSGVSEPDPTT